MLKVTVQIDLSEMTRSIYTQVQQAVTLTALEGKAIWQNEIKQARLRDVEKQAYMDSLKTEMTGDFSADLFTDYRLAGEIENGRPPRDLKKNLLTSRKTRVSKKGQKYLIIPFRHNTPDNNAHAKAMPVDVYNEAKALTKSRVLSMYTRQSATGHTVPQAFYQWGDRLPAGLTPKLKDHHKTDIHAGMVRFNTSSGKQNSSQYLTFRVMGEWSTGWIIPAQAGLNLAKNTQEQMQPLLANYLKGIV